MTAGKGIARGGGDCVAGRDDAAVPDPRAIDTGAQLHHGVGGNSSVIGSERKQSASFVNAPIEKRRHDDEVGDSKKRDRFHKRCQRVVDSVAEALKQQEVIKIHKAKLLV